MWDFLKVYGPIFLVVALGFYGAYQFVDPAPPRTLTLATGNPEGAYAAYGERYREILGESGIEVTLVPSAGSAENLSLLAQEPNDSDTVVDLAFVQSGVGTAERFPALEGLASLYFEPLWIFVRAQRRPQRLAVLSGKRLAIGQPGSGTRDVALRLLGANSIGPGDRQGTETLELSSADAVEAMLARRVDAAFFVTANTDGLLAPLFDAPRTLLMSFERAEAYTRRFRDLSRVTLPEGLINLSTNRPDEDITLLSPVATLVAREDLHPALVDLILRAAARIHGPGGLFETPGQFPSSLYLDFPLSPEAERYFTSGIPFLRRVLPFWAATLVERMWVMILPLLALLIPLMRIAPPTYRWQVRRRIVRWYKDLRRLEARLATADPDARAKGLAELERLQRDVGRVSVPLSYADNLYHLRLHIDFVRQRFERASHD
ncbi:MAG: TAXI family TRAP transporter solute-binding subunit [Pseudomonadota bacterium]